MADLSEALGVTGFVLAGLLVLFICAAAFFYGYRKRSGGLFLVSLSSRDIKRAQAIRFLSLTILISLLLSALFLSFSGIHITRKTGVVAYVFDESRSQSAEDASGVNRIERAKAFSLELDDFPYSRVAVYGFTDRAFSHSSFSNDHDYFTKTVQHLVAIEAVPGSGTDLGFSLINVLEDAVEEREASEKDSAIVVVLSDGENIGELETLVDALKFAERNNVKMLVVGVGENPPTRIPIYEEGVLIGYEEDARGNEFMTGLDESTLRFMAEGRGVYVRESEIVKARDFIGEELVEEEIENKGAHNPLVAYLLFAAIAPFVILIRYSKP